MLPPFPTQTEEIKLMGKHCTTGIDIRISNERVILLDAQVRHVNFSSVFAIRMLEQVILIFASLVKEIPFALQPVYSPSVLIDMMRPDGSSAVPVLNGEPLSADLAHELMGIQVKTVLQLLNPLFLLLIRGKYLIIDQYFLLFCKELL